MAVLNGVDAIAFTAGVGENGYEFREGVIEGLENLGIVIDKEKNKNAKRGEFAEIEASESKTKIYVIPTNEEIMIARETVEVLKNAKNG